MGETKSFKGFSFDFTGVEPAGDFSVVLLQGVYKGIVTNLRDHNNGAWLEVNVPSQRGRSGGPVSTYMATPTEPGDFPARKWMSLLVSVGYAKEKVQKKISIESKNIVGKAVHFRYVPPAPSDDPEAKEYPEITFLSKAQFETEVASEEAEPAPAAAPVAASTPAPAAKSKPKKEAVPVAPAAPAAASTVAAPPPAAAPAVDDLDAALGLD